MDEMQKLVRGRGGHRAAATRCVNGARNILADYQSTRSTELEALCAVLLEKLKKLSELDEEIFLIKTADANVTDADLAAELKENTDVSIKIREILHEAETKRRPGNVEEERQTLHSASSSSAQRVKLPKIELEKFSGDPKRWQSWWDCFESVIHNNDLSNIDKFNYLQCLFVISCMQSGVCFIEPIHLSVT